MERLFAEEDSNDKETVSISVAYRRGQFYLIDNGQQIVLHNDIQLHLKLRKEDFEKSQSANTGDTIPFLKEGTTLYFGIHSNSVTHFREGLLVKGKTFVPWITFEFSGEELNSIKKNQVEFLWIEIKLKENLWLLDRGDLPARLLGCIVCVPALESHFRSVNEAITACIRMTQRNRRSASANAFRTCIVRDGEGNFESLDQSRSRVLRQWRKGEPAVTFDNEEFYNPQMRKKLTEKEVVSVLWMG